MAPFRDGPISTPDTDLHSGLHFADIPIGGLRVPVNNSPRPYYESSIEGLVFSSEAVHCPQCAHPEPKHQFFGFRIESGTNTARYSASLPAPRTVEPGGSCGHQDGPGSCDS